MIDAVLSVLKPIGAPGSIPFLVIGLVVALAMTFVWPRSRRAGRYWLMSLLTFYLLMALPIVAKMVAQSHRSIPSSYSMATTVAGESRRPANWWP
jgi:ABC-type Fe3+ transport system permease subunit